LLQAQQTPLRIEIEAVDLLARRLARALPALAIGQRIAPGATTQARLHLGRACARHQALGHGRATTQGQRHGKPGQSGAQAVHARAASRWAFTSLDLMRLRLSGERYSTNTLPRRWSISCWMQTASMPSAS